MSEALAVVVPITVTNAILISSDVPETDYTAWSALTTYAEGARTIIVGSTHKIYESVIAGNIGKNPLTETNFWVEVSSTNRWKCFDTSNSTQTAQSTSAQYVLNFSEAITHLAVLNLTDVVSIQVIADDPTFGVVYDKTIYTTKILTSATWYAFLLGAKRSSPVAIFEDIPNYPSANITINFVGLSTMAFGIIVPGVATTIGQGVFYGVTVGIQDYSRKETNAYGDTVLVQRAYAKKAKFELRLLASEVDTVTEFLSGIRATPCLWIGSALYNSTVIFGIYEDFSVTIVYFDSSRCSLSILGLT